MDDSETTREFLAYDPRDFRSVKAALRTDIGCRREANEDWGEVVYPRDLQEQERKGILVVVADGIGGHNAGEVASRLAVEILRRVYYESASEPGESLRQAFCEANEEICRLSETEDTMRGMGSTCTALAVHGAYGYSAHIGDSRLYLIRAARLYRMTEDDSLVAELRRQGILKDQDPRMRSDRNVLLRALGSQRELKPAVWERPLQLRPGDRFVLCSDGLYDVVGDDEILRTSMKHDPDAACETLIRMARERGGPDNITVAIVVK